MDNSSSPEFNFDSSPAPKLEFLEGAMVSATKWVRGLYLAAMVASVGISASGAHAAPAEAAKVSEARDKTGQWIGKTLTCYASSKKEAQEKAMRKFLKESGKSREEVDRTVEFEVKFEEETSKVTASARLKEQGPSHMPEIRNESNGEPALEIGTRAQNAELNKRLFKIIGSSYDRALKRNPTLKGKLVIKFVIEKNGSVGKVGFGRIKDGLENKELENAIRDSIGSLRFKPQEEEQPIELPITLAPKG